MKNQLLQMTLEVDLAENERLELPEYLLKGLSAGKWLITIQPKNELPVKTHAAFLNSYTDADEGLYDDYSGR